MPGTGCRSMGVTVELWNCLECMSVWGDIHWTSMGRFQRWLLLGQLRTAEPDLAGDPKLNIFTE